jgi:hypothetical protein
MDLSLGIMCDNDYDESAYAGVGQPNEVWKMEGSLGKKHACMQQIKCTAVILLTERRLVTRL